MRCHGLKLIVVLLAAQGCSKVDETARDRGTVADRTVGDKARPAEAGVVVDGGGAVCPASFTACGGNVVGNWSLIKVCPAGGTSLTKPCDHPYTSNAACTGAGNEATCTNVYGGTIGLAADGKSTVLMSLHGEMAISLTSACVLAVTGQSSAADACAGLTTPSGKKLTCAFAAEVCRCSFSTEPETETKNDVYQVTGTDLVVTPSATGEKIGGPYCVTGDEMVMRGVIGWAYWILRRMP